MPCPTAGRPRLLVAENPPSYLVAVDRRARGAWCPDSTRPTTTVHPARPGRRPRRPVTEAHARATPAQPTGGTIAPMNTPADRQPATLVLDAARMRLAVAVARAAEADQHAATHAEAARRRQATIEQLVRLRATAGRLSVLIAANQRETAAAAEQLTHFARRPVARRHRRQTGHRDPYPHLRRLTAGQLDVHLRQLSSETADLLARLDRIAALQRQAQTALTRPGPRPLLSPTQIANRRAELTHATIAYVQARDRALPAPDGEGTGQTTTVELTRRTAERMARQLTGYLTGPGRDRAHWTRRVGTDEAPYWTTGALHDRWWAVHIPAPARQPTADSDSVDPGFLTALGQAVATVAAAEQRPTSAVITDILTTGRRTRTTQPVAPAAGAALAARWQAHTPRARAPRVIVRPTRGQRLDPAIGKVFAYAYRQSWRHQLHTLLVAEGTAALARLATHGDPPPPPTPRDRDQPTRLYDQITAGSVENYLTGHGWRPLDQTTTVRRWHNRHDAIVEIPTDDGGVDRQAMLRATAHTLAEREQRDFGEVLVELTDPPLRDPHLARVHTLLTRPPPVSDAQVAARLATARVPTGGGQAPLAEFARHQLATLGVSDAVWKVATAAGQADAAARVEQLLRTTPAPPPPSTPAALFAAGPADPAEVVAARIWAAGTGLPPAQHARWFANTWWPYHLTATTSTVAAYLAGRLAHRPPAALPIQGGPHHDLFTATDAAALPDRSSHDRFVATYRIVDAACRPRAVEAAAQAVRDQLAGADLPVDEATLAAAAVYAGDPRRFAHPPSARRLRAALTAAWPAGTSQQAVPAAGRPRPPSFPPPWKALAAASRPRTPGGPPLVVDPARHRQRQLVATAAGAAHAGRLPTPPPTRAAPTSRPRR